VKVGVAKLTVVKELDAPSWGDRGAVHGGRVAVADGERGRRHGGDKERKLSVFALTGELKK